MKPDLETRRKLTSQLKEIITPDRWERFEQVLSFRTRHITVVLEDIFQPHNASAVIRTCELLGVQDLHIIENQNVYEVNPDIVVGSNKWMTIRKYPPKPQNTLKCYQKLRRKGYHIVATTPHINSFVPDDLPIDQKIALVFGNEGFGLSKDAINNADQHLRIPSFGFTESYNISVAVALSLYRLMERMRIEVSNWQLTDDERDALLYDFAVKSVRSPDLVVKRLLANI